MTPPRRDALQRKVEKVAGHAVTFDRYSLVVQKDKALKLPRADRAAMRRVVVKQRARYVWRYT